MPINRAYLVAAAAAALALAGCNRSGANSSAAAGGLAGNGNAVATAPAAGNAGATAQPPAGQDWTQVVTKTPEGGYRMGNPNAPVKLVEYGSRTCPHCAAFANEAEPLLKQQYVAPGKVSYEFRDYPIHAPDVAAILLGRCNGASTFFPLLEQMFADQDAVLQKWQSLPPSFAQTLQGKSVNEQALEWARALGYLQFVGQRGVPEQKAEACLADAQAADAIGNELANAERKYNVNSTPTFIINGNPAPGVYDWATLKPALDKALGS